ncbi:GPN-loop GTPase 1-like [Pecten maximus]|uniref:GPN-loop GTPase 1-like n=1 Tax=Pecten maximus TaxID=6579 RepID=UPI00145902F0|nr:GPN-loop GTPase 1-like [Pecten maximus]
MLKPNPEPKVQKPYRLSPDKREALRHQLDELLSQGIITPVSEKADLPITSPIVLVSKRCKDPSKLNELVKRYSFMWMVISFRDYRPQYEKLRREKEEKDLEEQEEQMSRLRMDMGKDKPVLKKQTDGMAITPGLVEDDSDEDAHDPDMVDEEEQRELESFRNFIKSQKSRQQQKQDSGVVDKT